jgi:hypothetical protein
MDRAASRLQQALPPRAFPLGWRQQRRQALPVLPPALLVVRRQARHPDRLLPPLRPSPARRALGSTVVVRQSQIPHRDP